MASGNGHQQLEDYTRVEQAIIYLKQNFKTQPNLQEVASSIGLSEYHFQRLFSRWAGISPKRFLQFLTVEHAKELLEESRNLLDVTYESGLSSPGRLHDLFVTCEAMTPGEYKKKAEGLTITFGFHPSPFGEALLATTGRGVCGLDFVVSGRRDNTLESLRQKWPKARFVEAPEQTRPYAVQIFEPVAEEPALPLLLKGTNFQIRVWEALLKIPSGTVVSYETLAARIGQPRAVRAVANAVGRNPIGFVIPCHRVIRKIGKFGGYQWGDARKQAMLAWESGRN